MANLNKYEQEFLATGYYFLDFTDIDCMKFHLEKTLREIENGEYKYEYQYQFAKEEVREYRKAIETLENQANN